MPELTTEDGVTIHYSDLGEGTPIVFLHGWAMSGAVWHSQLKLADRYRLIVPDFRGHGRSSAPDEGYSFDCFARDVAELVFRLNLERVIIVAWSMGALVALQTFPLIRERLAALILVAGTAKFASSDGYSSGVPSTEIRAMGRRLQKYYTETIRSFVSGMFTEEERASGICEQLTAPEGTYLFPDPHAAREALKSLAAADLRDLLPSVHLPVLLIHGSADTTCPVDAANCMAKLLPKAELSVMTGVGHAPFMSRPEEFAAILGSFLEGIDAEN